MPKPNKLSRYCMSNEAELSDAWIIGFPRGEAFIAKYQETLKFDDEFFAAIAEAFHSEKLSKPFVDIEHDFGRSMGDIVDYDIRADGMYFKVALTAEGEGLVKNNGYKYVSPAWGTVIDTDGNEWMKLHTISFTNYPAFEGLLPTLQSQLYAASNADVEMIVVKLNKKGESNMDLTKILSLSKDASDDSIYSAVVELSKKADESAAKVLELAKTLTDAESKKLEAENKAIELGKKLIDIEKKTLSAEADAFLKTNIELGKIHPATQDIWRERYVLNAEAVKKEMELIPAKEGGQLSANGAPASKVDAKDESIMLNAGLDPKNAEDVKIFLASKQNIKGE